MYLIYILFIQNVVLIDNYIISNLLILHYIILLYYIILHYITLHLTFILLFIYNLLKSNNGKVK